MELAWWNKLAEPIAARAGAVLDPQAEQRPERVTAMLSSGTLDRLEAYAKAHRWSRSRAIETLIEAGLAQQTADPCACGNYQLVGFHNPGECQVWSDGPGQPGYRVKPAEPDRGSDD